MPSQDINCLRYYSCNVEAGKEPVWKDSVVLTFFDENQIMVKAYDHDTTENEYMGSGKL